MSRRDALARAAAAFRELANAFDELAAGESPATDYDQDRLPPGARSRDAFFAGIVRESARMLRAGAA